MIGNIFSMGTAKAVLGVGIGIMLYMMLKARIPT